MKEIVTIIIPVLNEENSIISVIHELKNALPDVKIIIVNDGSTDSTPEKIESLNVDVLNHDKCYGYGTALRTGIESSNSSYVLFCDGDGQHRTNDVIKLINECTEYDMVIGARGKDSHIQINRLPGKTILQWLAKILIGQKVPDLNSGLRIVRKSLIDKYLNLMPHGFSFSTTCTFAFLKDNRSVHWVPIKVNKRKGTSTVNQFRDGLSTILLLIRLSILFEPLKIFLFSTFILLMMTIISFMIGFSIDNELNITDSTVILGLGTLIVFLSGLICDQVSGMRRSL